MENNMITLDQDALGQLMSPEALASLEASQRAAMTSIGGGINTISFKGRRFTLRTDGVADELPGNTLDAVILHVDAVDVRKYYQDGYSKDAKNKVTCWSTDGVNPDKEVPASNKQNMACDTCPMNQKGSASDKQGKACSRSRRVILGVPTGRPDYPLEAYITGISGSSIYGDRNPAAGIYNFGEVLQNFNAIGRQAGRFVPLFALWVTVSFTGDSVPITQFSFRGTSNQQIRPVGSEIQEAALKMYEPGGAVSKLQELPAVYLDDDPVEEESGLSDVKEAPTAAPTRAPTAAAAKPKATAPAPSSDELDDLDLSDLM